MQAMKMTAEVYKAVKPIWTQIDRLYPAICAIEGATLALSEMAEPQRCDEAIAADAIFWLADRLKEHVEALKQQHSRCYDATGIRPKSPPANVDDGSESIWDLYRRWTSAQITVDGDIPDKQADEITDIERQVMKIRTTSIKDAIIKLKILDGMLGELPDSDVAVMMKGIETDLTALAAGRP